MKTAKVRRTETQKRTSARDRQSAATAVAIPPEARRSTAAALLKYAPGWTGDDLEDVIAAVKGTRAKTRF